MESKSFRSLQEAAIQVQLDEFKKETLESSTFIPNDPDVDKYWGGKKKADELRRRLGQRVVGDRTIERKIPKVKITKKKATRKKKGQLELFAANQYFGGEINESFQVVKVNKSNPNS